MLKHKGTLRTGAVAASVAGLLVGAGSVAAGGSSFIGGLHTISVINFTTPSNGDQNPYGITVVPETTGRLHAGHVLVSNFNNAANKQGLGTTIVQLNPASGSRTLFAQIDKDLPGCPGGVGLTTALAVLNKHWVIVGSLPTTDGVADTAKAGCLIILNDHGHVVETLRGTGINGPWDLAATDRGDDSYVFITNVLNGTVAAGGNVVNRGTVERLVLDTGGSSAPSVDSRTEIGSGFSERSDPSALVIGPTGLGLSNSGWLYVADTLNNRIAAIPDALHRSSTAFTGADVTSNGAVNGPLGLALAPNGDILTVNGGDGNIVEVTPSGVQDAPVTIESNGAGTLFGLAVTPSANGVYFVDDFNNTLRLLH